MSIHQFPQPDTRNYHWSERVAMAKACAARGDAWMEKFHLARIADEAERADDREWLNAAEYASECDDYADLDFLIEQQDAIENAPRTADDWACDRADDLRKERLA